MTLQKEKHIISLSKGKATINCASEHLNYIVGVLKNDGRLVLLDTRNQKDDQPRFVPKNSASNVDGTSSSSHLIKRKDMEARNALGMAFGSKKRRLDIKSATENMIHVSSLKQVESALQSEMQHAVELHDQINQDELVDRVIPKHDLNASTPQEVYDLNDIIPSNEFKSIQITAILNLKTLDELQNYVKHKLFASDFIIDRLYKQIQQGHSKKKLKMLIYLASLMKLYTLSDKNIFKLYVASMTSPKEANADGDDDVVFVKNNNDSEEKEDDNGIENEQGEEDETLTKRKTKKKLQYHDKLSFVLCRPPQPLNLVKKFLQVNTRKSGGGPVDDTNIVDSSSLSTTDMKMENNATDHNKNSQKKEITSIKWTSKHKDKCLAYLLTLALMIDDYSLDPSLIAQDLKLSNSKVTSILKELGCKVDSKVRDDKVNKLAKLMVPLSFPKRTR